MTDRLKAAALEWATKRGVPVFPLNADNSPATRNGFHDASTDPAVIERMTFEHGIGGVPGAAGFVVLDVDTKHGASLGDVPAELAETLRYKTRSGGFHLWCRAEPGKDYGNGPRLDLGQALDIRHDRGYVALAPTPGYRLDNADAFDAELCVAAPAALEGSGTGGEIRSAAPAGAGPPIPKGSQEGTLFAIARAAYDAGLDELAVRAAIRSSIATRCLEQDPRRPWAEHDVERIARPTLDTFSAAVRSGRLSSYGERIADMSDDELEWLCMADVEPREAVMYPGRLNIPENTISVLTGEQGVGKGQLAVAEATVLSLAGHGVVFISDEDSAAFTISPRLVASGADRSRVFMPSEHVIKLPDDIDKLGELVKREGVKLVVIDPWTNHLGEIDVNKGPEVRTALMQLKVACERYEFVALLTAHPNKNSENHNPLERVAHASAITQVARSAFWIVQDPRPVEPLFGAVPLDGRANDRLVAQVKANLTPLDYTRQYRVSHKALPGFEKPQPRLGPYGGQEGDGGIVMPWLEIHRAMRKAAHATPAEAAPARTSAEQAIVAHLEQHGTAAAGDLKALASDKNTGDRALARLRDDGKIERTHESNKAPYRLTRPGDGQDQDQTDNGDNEPLY